MTLTPAEFDALEWPRNCEKNDFWGQVRRTVNGKPVPQEQLDMIFSRIEQGLSFNKQDVLLDLACGNGRLGVEFFDKIEAYVGVDMSDALIDIAKQYFEKPPEHTFFVQKIQDYVIAEKDPQKFTKCLWYGAFSFLSIDDAHEVLSELYERFVNLGILFIGTIPDKNRAKDFFEDRQHLDLADHTTVLGRWYTQGGFRKMAKKSGWNVALCEFPKAFHQSHYRFNAILTPRDR